MARAIYTAKQFIDAIPGTGGIITAIARKVGCDWYTVKRHIDKQPTVARAYQDETEKIADLAETKLIEQMNEGDGPMIRFFLSTKAKHRGYTQQVDLEQTGEMILRVVYGNKRADDKAAGTSREAAADQE